MFFESAAGNASGVTSNARADRFA